MFMNTLESHEEGIGMRYPLGVLMMAYGGPNSLDEIPGYLADIRSGRPTPARIVEEIRNNYRQIGGKSPLLESTRNQVAAVQAQFNPEHFRFYLGMRHWSPWIEDTVREMLQDGITHAISIVLAPHYSQMSIARYQAKISAGLEIYRGHIEFAHIESYHDAPGLIQALANRVEAGLSHWPVESRPDVHVVFSAHSLPVRITQLGDPYTDQLHETARLVAAKAGLGKEQWSWSYQSAGRSSEPWLGPQLPEHLEALAKEGIGNVVSVPVGFVSDHVEILYDIDIQAQQAAKTLGIRLERPPALNEDPIFIKTIARIIQDCAKKQGWIQELPNILQAQTKRSD
jgi:protoporphyrin/coproporphyrin ferrochelatase